LPRADLPGYQAEGFGKPLMQTGVYGGLGAWLSEDRPDFPPEKPAPALYEACGFFKQGLHSNYP